MLSLSCAPGRASAYNVLACDTWVAVAAVLAARSHMGHALMRVEGPGQALLGIASLALQR
jgi:hypothetical protein